MSPLVEGRRKVPPLAADGFDYVYSRIKSDVHLASISGGTDLIGSFVGGDPTGGARHRERTTLTLAGQVIRATAGNKPFSKVGPGTLILISEDTSGFNSTVNLNNGTLILAGSTGTAGDIASAVTVNLNNGTLLRLDNSAGNNQDRIGNAATVNFSGANLHLKGNSGEATTENVAA